MNRLALTLVLACVSFSIYAQQVGDSAHIQMLLQFQPTAGPTRTPPAKRLSALNNSSGYFKNEGAYKLAELKRMAETGPRVQRPYNSPAARVNATCEDTSYSRLLGIENGLIFVNAVTKTRDGHLLVTGEMGDTTLANPFHHWYGYLMKLNDNGDILWVKVFEENVPGYSAIWYAKAHELNNGDIVFTALYSVDPNGSRNDALVLRLTSTGNITWQTGLRSNMAVLNSPQGTFRLVIEAAMDGLNGDVIITGTDGANISWGHTATVMRLNNQGRLVWDANYGNYGTDGSYKFGLYGVSSYMQNGQIRLVAMNSGAGAIGVYPTLTFLTLDYASGNQLAAKFFRTNYPDFNLALRKSFGPGYFRVRHLQNGNLLFYGRIFSNSGNLSFKEFFGVSEFDANLDLVDSYTVGADVLSNSFNSMIHFDEAGKGYASGFELTGAYDANIYFASFQNRQFLKQRKLQYTAGMGGSNGVAATADNGYAYMQTHWEPVSGISYIEFTKMHDSDTSSYCMGKDTMLFEFSDLNLIETNESALLDPNWPDTLDEIVTHVISFDRSSHFINRCKQTNICDTVKIHGESKICGNQSWLDFTAFKKSVCGGIVQWKIDKAAIDSMHVLSDSAVRIWFKNVSWKGKLYALLPAGACFLPALDSMELHIIRSQPPINLGVDVEMCNTNPVTFHAGHTFANYLWQDGSTDSTLTIAAPGKYWVTANDTCGNNFSDTVVVIAFNVTVDIGPDRTKCNNDTLHLDAPAGFINYRWTNDYDASLIPAQNIVVNPPADMAYYLAAEKKPGCFSYDTIQIQVQTSPPINLGSDTRFCTGDSLLLDAGNAFASYTWSNSLNGRQIMVKSSGEYSVTGIYSNGCSSSDTLRVLPLFTLPVVSLDDNPELCIGSTRMLQAGNFTSYLWHDGSTDASYEAGGTGVFFVTVEDNNGCKGSDTVRITQILPLPANFLPGDTAICNYASLLLRPQGNYSEYLWNTNATGVSITITQPGEYWLRVTDNHDCTAPTPFLYYPKNV